MMLGRAVIAASGSNSPSVALAEPPERRVFQRGTTTASVPLSGTWVAGTAGIEGRVINDDTSAEVAAWATIVANPTGSTWSGNLTVPQGGWYRVEVRRTGVTASVKTSANRFGVGDVWMFAGESQQLLMNTLVGTAPTPDDFAVCRVSDGTWRVPGTFAGTGGNGAIRFLNLMRTYTGVPQALVNASVSGTAISDWELADSAMVAARDYISSIGTLRGILWHQGNSDIPTAITKSDYKTALASVRASFSGAGSTGLFSVFPLLNKTEGSDADANLQKIRQAHYEYISENPSTVNLGWTPDVPLSDGVNQTAAGSEVIAYSYAHALLYSMGVVTEQSIGPRITAATRNGAVVTLTVVHNGGTSLKTQTGVTPTGFQVFPRDSAHSDGAALAISSVALAASAITITLSADPGTPVDVYYQYGKFDSTAPVFDNSTALGRTVGNPLQPLMVPVQSPVEVAPLANPAVKLNGTDTWVRWSDSVRWDMPDADWTMGIFAKISSTDPNGLPSTSYILSGGNYVGGNSFNLLLYENNAGSGNANKVEFSIKGGGTSTFIAKPETADLAAVDPNWRWWIMEFVKSTETINLYFCNINGARTLYATVAAPALGVVGPTTGPAAGTRAPPAVGSGLYLNGGVYEFFKINGLLTAGEVAQLATGVDIRTGLGKTTQIHHYFRSLSTPIADAAGTGLAAALNGPVALFEGPIYT